MKKDIFSGSFGFHDKGLKKLIEGQSNTESRLKTKENGHNVKKKIKTMSLKVKKTRR